MIKFTAMERELNRSVRLLEDALSPHGKSLLRTGTPKRNKSNLKMFSMDEIEDISVIPNDITFNKEPEQFSFLKDNTSASLLENRLVNGVSATSKPWENVLNSMFVEYLEVIQGHTNMPQVFETVQDLARCCSDTLNVVRDLKSKVKGVVDNDERWLENERNTWRLIYCLYQNRLSSDSDGNNIQYFGVSEKLCIENLYRQDPLMRETQLIIDWLECNAHDKESFMPRIEYFTDKTVGWENTLHQLQSAETIVFKSNRPIITEMDPDAPFRQGLPLHDLDIEDEERLCKKIFIDIRCGKFEEAQKLCLHCGHSWRAMLLEGWRLHHDPNANHNENVDKNIRHPIEGNENRDLWKKMAWEYCHQNNLNIYERATIASFCGCLDTLLTVCKTWEDTLWAYMKTMVDIRVESEIRDYVRRNYRALPDEYWKNKMSMDEIFMKISSCPHPKIRAEAEEPDHIIQKYIILDQIPQLMVAIDKWTEQDVSPHFIRFLAHLVLFLRQIGQSQRDDIAEKVLQLYVKILIEKNEPQMIAYYTATLGKDLQIEMYSSFLENITDNKERKEALQYGEDCGLDIKTITKHVTEKIINKHDDDIMQLSVLQKQITEKDKIKISALDWVLFYPSQAAESIYQSNLLVSYFLVLGKMDAAKLAFSKIPIDYIDQILSAGESEVPEHVHRWIREHISYKAYLDSHEAFNDWFKYFHHSKPVLPATLSENASFPEKVAYEHKLSQYQADSDRWRMTVTHLAKTAKTKLYNVLLFPDGGWLTGAENSQHLRAHCIPETVLLLYSVLSESGDHAECLQLGDIIASEKHMLYKVYTRNKLEDFLQKISETAVKLLDEKNDMWVC